MARRTKRQSSSERDRSRKQLGDEIRKHRRELWDMADIDRWLSYLVSIDPGGRWHKSGDRLHGLCRNHNDTNPSLQVRPSKHYAICYSCPTRFYASNPVDLLRSITKKPAEEIIRELQHVFNKTIFKGGLLKEFQEYEGHNKIKWLFYSAMMNIKHKIFAAYVNRETIPMKDTEYHYAFDACEFLNYRKILDVCTTTAVGVLSPLPIIETELIAMGLSQEDHTKVVNYADNLIKTGIVGDILFTYFIEPTLVSNFRFRKPQDEKKGNIYAPIDPYEDRLGIFGFDRYLNIHRDALGGIGNTDFAYMAEGEIDMLQMAQQQKDNSNYDIMILSHSGGANHNISDLPNYGIKTIYYVPDLDDGGIANTRELLKQNTGVNFQIFNWPLHLRVIGPEESTDLDSALLRYGFTAVNDALKDKDKNFIKRDSWCTERCKEQIKIPVAQGDIITVKKLVSSWAECVGDLTDNNMAAYIGQWAAKILNDVGISAKDASRIANAIAASKNPEETLAIQIEEQLSKRFAFMYIDKSSDRKILAWDRERKDVAEIRFSDPESFFGTCMGQWHKWVSSEIGETDLIKYGKEIKEGEAVPPELSMIKKEAYLKDLVSKCVFKDIIRNLPIADSLNTKGQGNHYLPVKNGGRNWFIVNGPVVLRGWYDSNSQTNWEQLDEPKYEDYFFDVKNNNGYTPHIKSVDDLINAPVYPLEEIFKYPKEVVNTGWVFNHQELDILFLASLVCIAPIIKIFPQNMNFFASNEASSGKTTLVSKLIGGAGDSFYNLVEHSVAYGSFTDAGFRQATTNNPRILVLDECDSHSDKTQGSVIKGAIQQLIRISYDNAKHVQGTSSGKSMERELSCSSFMAGIFMDIDPSTLTRMFKLDLKSVPNRMSPDDALDSLFPRSYFEEARRRLSLSMFHWAPAILAARSEILKEFKTDKTLIPSFVHSRWRDTISILLAPLKVMGLDWKDILRRYIAAKAHLFDSVFVSTEYNSLFNSIMVAPEVRLKGMETVAQNMTVESLLKKTEDRTKLNDANCGIRIIEEDGKVYMAIMWAQARLTLLKNIKEYSSLGVNSFRDRISNHPLLLDGKTAKGIVDRHITLGRTTAVSVLDVTKFIGELKTNLGKGDSNGEQQESGEVHFS